MMSVELHVGQDEAMGRCYMCGGSASGEGVVWNEGC
jgi:hypothetical protein